MSICFLATMLLAGCSGAQPSKCEIAADCNDGDDCTADVCDQSSETCSNPPVVDGMTCDFGGLPGVCMAGVCEEDLCDEVDCDDGEACTDDACDPADGECGHTPVADDTACDFEGFPGLCKAGVCEDAKRCEGIDCSDGEECTEDVCDRVTGMCSNPPVTDGTPCDGGASTCLGGACAAAACTNAANAEVYSNLEYVNDDGMSSGTDAAAAIANDCLFGSPSSEPPLEDCRNLAGQVLPCAIDGSCAPELIQELNDCIELCMQDTIELVTGSRLTAECANCYGPNVSCNITLCVIASCGSIPSSEMCIECRCDNECPQAFAFCSGIPSDECN